MPNTSPELDFTSKQFDPILALASKDLCLPYPKAKIYDNLADWYSHAFSRKKNDTSSNQESKTASKHSCYVLKRNYEWYYETLGLDLPHDFDIQSRHKKYTKRKRSSNGKYLIDKNIVVKEMRPEILQPMRSSKILIKRFDGSLKDIISVCADNTVRTVTTTEENIPKFENSNIKKRNLFHKLQTSSTSNPTVLKKASDASDIIKANLFTKPVNVPDKADNLNTPNDSARKSFKTLNNLDKVPNFEENKCNFPEINSQNHVVATLCSIKIDKDTNCKKKLSAYEVFIKPVNVPNKENSNILNDIATKSFKTHNKLDKVPNFEKNKFNFLEKGSQNLVTGTSCDIKIGKDIKCKKKLSAHAVFIKPVKVPNKAKDFDSFNAVKKSKKVYSSEKINCKLLEDSQNLVAGIDTLCNFKTGQNTNCEKDLSATEIFSQPSITEVENSAFVIFEKSDSSVDKLSHLELKKHNGLSPVKKSINIPSINLVSSQNKENEHTLAKSVNISNPEDKLKNKNYIPESERLLSPLKLMNIIPDLELKKCDNRPSESSIDSYNNKSSIIKPPNSKENNRELALLELARRARKRLHMQ